MPKRTLPTKSIDEPKSSDLDSVMIRMDRVGELAELRVAYRLRDGDNPTEVAQTTTLDTKITSLAANDRVMIGKVAELALALVKAAEGPFNG